MPVQSLRPNFSMPSDTWPFWRRAVISGWVLVLSSDICLSSVYYSITSTWNYRDSAARGDMNNNRACSPHQLSDAHAHAHTTTTKKWFVFFGKFIHSKQLIHFHNFCNCIWLKHSHYNLSKTSHQPAPSQCLHSESAATPYRQYTPPSVHRCVPHAA